MVPGFTNGSKLIASSLKTNDQNHSRIRHPECLLRNLAMTFLIRLIFIPLQEDPMQFDCALHLASHPGF
jgi:hypothetical protein